MKIEKQIFGKQMWAEPCKDDEWDPVASDLLRPCPMLRQMPGSLRDMAVSLEA